MKDVDNYLEKLNNTIASLQEEANFFMVFHVFGKLKEFQTLLEKETSNTDITLSPINRLDGGLLINFDNSEDDLGEYFSRIGISLQRGWRDVENNIDFKNKVTIPIDMDLETFISKYTTTDYQKQYLAYTLDNQLISKKDNRGLKI